MALLEQHIDVGPSDLDTLPEADKSVVYANEVHAERESDGERYDQTDHYPPHREL